MNKIKFTSFLLYLFAFQVGYSDLGDYEADVSLANSHGLLKLETKEDFYPNYEFVNFDIKSFKDKGIGLGLRFAAGGFQFNERIPYKISSRLPERAIDYGLMPSPFVDHQNKNIPLTFGYFEEDRGQGKSAYGNNNCFSCHATTIGHSIVGGAPNKDLDLKNLTLMKLKATQLSDEALKNPPYNLTDTEIVVWKGYSKQLTNLMGKEFIKAKVLGDNFGQYISYAYAAFLKPSPQNMDDVYDVEHSPSLQKLKDVFDCPTCVLAPIHAQPWWVVKYKKKHYWFADSSVDNPIAQAHDFVVNFSLPHAGIPGENPDWQSRVQSQARIFSYIKQTHSPVHPDVKEQKINKQLATEGYEIFHGLKPASKGLARCSSCHGSYVPSKEGYEVYYKDKKFSVGTDPVYHQTLQRMMPLANDLREATKSLNTANTPNYLVPDMSAEAAYAAPPLDGVWATGPYFHNGSVPTILEVLQPSLRPKFWVRTPNAEDYDFKNLGVTYKVTATNKDAQRNRIYDTTWPAYSNQGHEKQVSVLSEKDALALIEFFKCLGGPKIVPGKSEIQ